MNTWRNGIYATASHDTRALKAAKDEARAAGYPLEMVDRIVREWMRPDRFAHLRGRENVFLPAPSTTHTNKIPVVFARALRAEFGGAVIRHWAETTNTRKTSEKGGFGKLSDPIAYQPGRNIGLIPADAPIVLVDDAVTTGETTDALRSLLRSHGREVSAVVSLGQSELRMATRRDLDRLVRKLGGGREIEEAVDVLYAGRLKHKANYTEKALHEDNRQEFRDLVLHQARRLSNSRGPESGAERSLPLGSAAVSRLQSGALPGPGFLSGDPRHPDPVSRTGDGEAAALTMERQLTALLSRQLPFAVARTHAQEIIGFRHLDVAAQVRMNLQIGRMLQGGISTRQVVLGTQSMAHERKDLAGHRVRR